MDEKAKRLLDRKFGEEFCKFLTYEFVSKHFIKLDYDDEAAAAEYDRENQQQPKINDDTQPPPPQPPLVGEEDLKEPENTNVVENNNTSDDNKAAEYLENQQKIYGNSQPPPLVGEEGPKEPENMDVLEDKNTSDVDPPPQQGRSQEEPKAQITENKNDGIVNANEDNSTVEDEGSNVELEISEGEFMTPRWEIPLDQIESREGASSSSGSVTISSNDDASSDLASRLSLCSRTTLRQITSNKAKNAYSMTEDWAILKYIIDTGRYSDVKGVQLWYDLERHFAQHQPAPRSWQSLKERFRKSILKKLDFYGEAYDITEDIMIRFKRLIVKRKNELERLEIEAPKNPSPSKKKAKTETKPSTNRRRRSSAADDHIATDERMLELLLATQGSLQNDQIWPKVARQLNSKVAKTKGSNSQNTKLNSWQTYRDRFVQHIMPRLDQYEAIASYQDALRLVDKCETLLSRRDRSRIKQLMNEKFNGK